MVGNKRETRSKKQIKFTLIGLFLCLLFINPLYTQTKQQLESKRKKLQLEIKQINELLSKTQKNEEDVLSQLNDINKRMEVHQNIIRTIKKENAIFALEIKTNKTNINQIEKEVKELKIVYKKMVISQYKSKSKNSRLLFLLSAKDFLQAYKRLTYMNQISDYRKKQAITITRKKELLLLLNDSIQAKKKIKDSLMHMQLKAQKIIDVEKNKKEALLKKVKKQERKYLDQIIAKQKKEAAYDKQLEDLIAKVIKRSNKKHKKNSKIFILTPESRKLASTFVKNKGKLPSPVRQGYVSRYFGKRKHEIMHKLSVKSSGWYYATTKNAKAQSVFNGRVKAIMVDKNTKIKTVIIQHGNYMTVYSNLEKLLVKEGDKIKTKQKLGTIHTDTTTGKTILKFALWKDAKAQNPSDWMHK